jgi:hypothetical protein
MFNKPSIADFFRVRFSSAKTDIAQKGEGYLVSVNFDEFIDYLTDKFGIQPITIDDERETTLEKIRKVHTTQNRLGEEIQGEILCVRINIPILPNDNARQIFEFLPSSFSLSMPEIIIGQGWISTDTIATEGDVDMVIKGLRSEIETRNKDIEQGNKDLKAKLRDFLKEKRSQLEKEQALLDSISKKVAVPLKQKVDVASVVPTAIKYNQALKSIAPPQANPPKEYVLERDKFNAILNLIDNSCRMFERTPLTFSKLEEEELRNVILSHLNGVFDGNAVGEAFSKRGKTDIYLPVNKGAVFIAECKYWKGGKTLESAVKQILGYLTWRNSFGVLILFSNRKNFSDILAMVDGIIPNLNSYVRGKEKIAENHIKAFHYLPEDEKKHIEMHYLIYNLYCEPTK